jgi:hypothetical protein
MRKPNAMASDGNWTGRELHDKTSKHDKEINNPQINNANLANRGNDAEMIDH